MSGNYLKFRLSCGDVARLLRHQLHSHARCVSLLVVELKKIKIALGRRKTIHKQ